MSNSAPADPKRQVAANFNQQAQTYDRIRFVRESAARLVELAGLQPGERVLDVATGTGFAALAAARLVGPAAQVVGIDLAEEMLNQARGKAASEGIKNVEFQLGDAERPEFPDASFAVVLCASAIQFLPDPAGAVREWARLLGPGGRLLVSAYGPAWSAPMDEARARLQTYGVPAGRQPDRRTGDPEMCRSLLEEAGLVDIEVTVEQLGYYFPTVDEYWAELMDQVVGALVMRLEPEQREQFKREFLAEKAASATSEGIWRDATTIFARGRKPLAA
jgi:ubiquinone/menaquinone biosynthesis C-methylase UbiE